MSTYVGFRDGGKTNEEGFYRALRKVLDDVGVLGTTDLKVTQRGAGANKSVDIAAGDAFFTYNGYAFHGWNTATVNDSSTIITDNTSGNARIDAVVAYIDLTVIDSTNSNNPGVLKFKVIAGTPAGSPAAPDDATIQTAIGASNPFLRLANVAVSNGFTSIVNADITDTRTVSTTIASSAGKAQFATTGEIADFSTTSTSFVDITGATITISPTGPAKIQAVVTGRWWNSSSGQSTDVELMIDGNVIQSYGMRENTATHEKSFALSGQASVAAGSRVIKARAKVGAGTGTYEDVNVNVIWALD